MLRVLVFHDAQIDPAQGSMVHPKADYNLMIGFLIRILLYMIGKTVFYDAVCEPYCKYMKRNFKEILQMEISNKILKYWERTMNHLNKEVITKPKPP